MKLMIFPGVGPPLSRVMASQKTLFRSGASTQCSATVWAVGVLIALAILMLYQSSETFSPGMNRGLRTTPAVQLLAVSSERLGLPPLNPGMLVELGSRYKAGLPT